MCIGLLQGHENMKILFHILLTNVVSSYIQYFLQIYNLFISLIKNFSLAFLNIKISLLFQDVGIQYICAIYEHTSVQFFGTNSGSTKLVKQTKQTQTTDKTMTNEKEIIQVSQIFLQLRDGSLKQKINQQSSFFVNLLVIAEEQFQISNFSKVSLILIIFFSYFCFDIKVCVSVENLIFLQCSNVWTTCPYMLILIIRILKNK
eukprot:TRINITY_DN13649_c0_g2_i1.p1 TRINITY_DN13649_c0_g2~~TRINITY_DN13649_c0_g2_i1.p1  ORF type:complete len:213 (+),score=-12.60 TRINITY_DN13649_c0_g2_i1:32-640(+)